MTTRFYLHRGDAVLGVVEHTGEDFPVHVGIFQPSEMFEAVRPLFAAELELLNENRLEEWRMIREQLEAPGVTLDPIGPGKTVYNPLIHIEGNRVWWR